MRVTEEHVKEAFVILREKGIAPNKASTKWDVIDPETNDRFPPKAVLRVAKALANDTSPGKGGGWPTNDPLRELGFDIALKSDCESSEELVDILAVLKDNVGETEKRRLINARVGQGGFREALLEIWEGKCAISGCEVKVVLRASHIKAWRDSSNRERLDPRNGILLAASIDALFDKHLITITESGSIRAAASLSPSALEGLGVSPGVSLSLCSIVQKYLNSHREIFEKQSGGKSFEY